MMATTAMADDRNPPKYRYDRLVATIAAKLKLPKITDVHMKLRNTKKGLMSSPTEIRGPSERPCKKPNRHNKIDRFIRSDLSFSHVSQNNGINDAHIVINPPIGTHK